MKVNISPRALVNQMFEMLFEHLNQNNSPTAKLLLDMAGSICLSLHCDLPPLGGALLYDNIKVTMTSKQLNGTQRVLLDGVINDDECRELHRLSNVSYGYNEVAHIFTHTYTDI